MVAPDQPLGQYRFGRTPTDTPEPDPAGFSTRTRTSSAGIRESAFVTPAIGRTTARNRQSGVCGPLRYWQLETDAQRRPFDKLRAGSDADGRVSSANSRRSRVGLGQTTGRTAARIVGMTAEPITGPTICPTTGRATGATAAPVTGRVTRPMALPAIGLTAAQVARGIAGLTTGEAT